MSLSSRLLAPIESALARTSGASYLCSSCRRQSYRPAAIAQCLNSHAHSHAQLRYKSGHGGGEFNEQLKSSLWGKNAGKTEEEYDDENILEKKLRGKQRLEPSVDEAALEADEANADEVPDGPIVAHVPVEAKSWEGLPVHQGANEKPWKREPYAGDLYEPFVNSEKVTDHRLLLSMVHQATVEMLLLKSLDKPIKNVCKYVNHDVVVPFINRVTIVAGKDFESSTLEFGNEQEKQKILAAFEDPKKSAPEELEAIIVSVPENLQFLQLPLADLDTKFILLKRVAQLTGHYFPNPELPGLSSVGSVLKYLDRASQPKPKKLVQNLLASEDLASLPNVKISPKKVSISDKESEIGRWKIIEEELARRGLPFNGDAQR
ncbi:hypothetical protein KEM56_007159 [Ascosphaera pollenicola]|nr:hypothetical protein KEM56_007159 [Ascosphaera pollenicola]